MFNRKKRQQENELDDKKALAKNAPKSGVVLPLSDEEPSEKFRLWWSENGKSIIAGVSLGIVAIIGYQYWQSSKATEAIEASGVFSQTLKAYETNNYSEVASQTQRLVDEYGSTDYAAQAQVLHGISLLKEKNIEGAISVLQDGLSRAKSPVTKHLSRLNLAKAQIEGGAYSDAVETLTINDVDGYELQYNELKADAFSLNGDAEKAKEMYQKVLESLTPNDPYVDVINVKINRL